MGLACFSVSSLLHFERMNISNGNFLANVRRTPMLMMITYMFESLYNVLNSQCGIRTTDVPFMTSRTAD